MWEDLSFNDDAFAAAKFLEKALTSGILFVLGQVLELMDIIMNPVLADSIRLIKARTKGHNLQAQ